MQTNVVLLSSVDPSESPCTEFTRRAQGQSGVRMSSPLRQRLCQHCPGLRGRARGAVPRLHHPLYMTLCARSNSSILQLVFTQNGWIRNLRTSLRGKDITTSAFCPFNHYSKDTIKHNLVVLCNHYILKVVSIIPVELNIEQEAADAICEAMKQRLCFFFHSFHNSTSTRLEND